jgi:hypothetical protein
MMNLINVLLLAISLQGGFEPVTANSPAAPIQVAFENTRLEDALREVAQRANLALSYRPDLPDLDVRVTFTMQGAAGAVILRCLAGSALEAQYARTSNALLLRKVVVARSRVADLSLDTPPIPIAEVVVTPGHFGVAHESGSKPQALSREQIETLPQFAEDIYRTVNRLPGITSNEMSAKFNIRGGDDQSILVRLDGLELYEPYHLKDFDGALSIIDVGAIGGVDLTTGGFGAQFGNRLTGVFDMRTTTALTPRPRTSLGLSISNVRFMSQGAFADNNGLWLLSARRGYLDILLDLIDEQSRLDPRYYDVLGKVMYQLSPAHRISVHALRAGDSGFFEDEDGVGSISSTYGSSYGWVVWDARFGSMNASTQLSAGRLDWDRDASEHGTGNDFDILEDRRYNFYSLKQDWQLGRERVLLKWGGEVNSGEANYDYYNRVARNHVENHTLVTTIDSIDLDLVTNGTNAALYGAVRVQPWSRLTLESGLRWDHQSHTDESQLLPRLHAALSVTDRTTLRATWGHYAQPHALYQLQVQDGVTAFQSAERAQQFVLGVEQRITEQVTARVEGYRRQESDVRTRFRNLQSTIEPVAEIEVDRVAWSPTRARAQGVEMFLQKQGARSSWSASYAIARAYDDFGDRRVDRQLDQRHTVYADYSIAPGPGWRLSAAWQYHSGWPATSSSFVADTLTNGDVFIIRQFGAPYADRLPSYHRMDLRATRTFNVRRGRISVFLDVFNAYDRDNPQAFEYNVGFNPGNGRLSVERNYQTLLPRLPTIGATWEF